MSEAKTGPGIIDTTSYWQASSRILEMQAEINAIPDYIPTTDDSREYDTLVQTLDETKQQIEEGRTSGSDILDRLIWSGQTMSKEQLEHISGIEQQLVIGEPALLQQGTTWRMGVIVHDTVHFSEVRRDSFFGPAANGYQSIPTKSYAELTIDPSIDRFEGYERFDVQHYRPEDFPPELGPILGLPLSDVGHNPRRFEYPIPAGLHAAWQRYDQTHGFISNEYGGRTHAEQLHVGQQAFEANLGISVAELFRHVDSDELMRDLTRDPLLHDLANQNL